MIGSELRNLILKIRNERKNKGNTKGRVADTFDGMMAFVDSKFIRNSSESLTILGTPTLTDNTLHLKYTGENGVEQTVSADLSGLTPEVILPTKTSEFQNDGEDGLHPFITARDIPAPIEQVNADWNATSGKAEILNKPIIPAPVDISGKLDKPLAPNNVPTRVVLADGTTKPLTEITTDISGKLDKPSQDGSWVVTKSGAIISYTDASNFGKNIGNSHITSIANSSFTLGANYTINTSGYFFNITNLPDKSSDITFQEMLVQNSSGQVARGNGKFLAKTMPSLLSDAEKTNWKTEMNGGWTTNTMSVALINPVISDNKSIKYLTIYGANLNLNPTNFKMEIMDETGLNVIAAIPNSQVILNNSTNLTFWFDFTGFSLGNFKIRLNNGVALYVTPITFSIVSSLQPINFSDNVWEKTTYSDIENPTVQQSTSAISVQNSSAVVPLNMDGKVTFTAMSKKLGTMADDFVIMFSIWNTANTNSLYTLFGGLCNDNVPTNMNNILAGAKCQDQHGFYGLFSGNVGSRNSGNLVILSKRGTFLTVVIIGNAVQIYTTEVSDQSTIPLRLKMAYMNNSNTNNIANLQILSAYKLN